MFGAIIYSAFPTWDEVGLAIVSEVLLSLFYFFEIVGIFFAVDIVWVAVLGEVGSGSSEQGDCVVPESVDYSH